MKVRIIHGPVTILSLVFIFMILVYSCNATNAGSNRPDPEIMKAEKPLIDTARVTELIELYRAKRYESIQEAVAAGPDNVLKLSFHGRKMGRLSSEIGRFTYLASLDLAYNELSVLPAEISSLHYLQGLYVNGNNLTAFPKQILLLPLLDRVDLSENQIVSLPPEIMKMGQLSSLNLGENGLSRFPVQLYGLSSLKVLNLEHNGFRELPEGLSNLKALKILDLSNNKLTKIPRELISLSGNLKELNIQGNQIAREEIDWLIKAMPETQIRY